MIPIRAKTLGLTATAVLALWLGEKPLFGQALGPSASFEVASVRPSDVTDVDASKMIRVSRTTVDRFEADGIKLRTLIEMAYGLQLHQKVVGASPLLEERFRVSAKTSPGVDLRVQERTVSDSPLLVMLRRLLAERFKLVVQWKEESRQVRVLSRYQGVALGPKLKPLNVECSNSPEADAKRCAVSIINGRVSGVTNGMSDFTSALLRMTRVPFYDETGLVGTFEISMDFDPATLSASPNASDKFSHLPTFSDALRRELGLRVDQKSRSIPTVLLVVNVEPLLLD